VGAAELLSLCSIFNEGEMKMKHVVTAAALVVLAAGSMARGSTIWDEFASGDLSDNRLSPNLFNLSVGSNVLVGFMAGADGQGAFDREFFSVTVPAGATLERIDLLFYESPDEAAFIGIQPGAIFEPDPSDVGPGDLLGFTLFGPPDVGTDLLADMSMLGQGFSTPLGAGTYAFWAQQTGDATAWTASFIVVPTPGVVGALALGAMATMRRRRA
jgi:MYXO-CTERM domain-containing protein